MGGFADLGAWEDIAGLQLPLRGRLGAKKLYRIPPVDAELGPRLQRMMSSGVTMAMAATARIATGDTSDQADGEDQVDGDGDGPRLSEAAGLDTELLSDTEELTLYQRVLGRVYDEMTADGVPWPALKHAAMTAIIDATYGRELAEQFWATAAAPGKPPGRATAAPNTKPKAKGRKGTGRRMNTASTAGTTPNPAPATVPAGRKSSSSGR